MKGFSGTDRFIIRRRLGAGAFGVAYEVFDAERRAVVALKIPHDGASRDLGRFRQEFRALAELEHANLAALYDVLSRGADWWYTLELVPGPTFLDGLRRGPGAEPDHGRVRELLRQMAAGLWTLHRAGWLHRDLKPAHARIAEDGHLVLLDYGFTGEGPLPGPGGRADLAYRAPERLGGQAPTPAGDWYSVGVMLYQALTGQLPYPGESFRSLIDQLRRDPLPPGELAPGTPPDLDRLCMDLLNRKPQLRPTGPEVLERLGAMAEPPIRPDPAPPRRARTSHLLIGRQQELAALDRAYARSQEGRAVVAFVHGDSGMGKNYLVRRFLRRLQRQEGRAVVLTGRCSEERSVPYKALESLMEGLAVYLAQLPPSRAAFLLPRDIPSLARIFPVLRPLVALLGTSGPAEPEQEPQEVRRRAFAALRELMMRLALRYPLVLVIENLQWGDQDSAALLSSILLGPDPPALLALFSCRSWNDPVNAALRLLHQRLGEEGVQLVDIPVAPIPFAESRRLAMAILGSRPTARTEGAWIARESGGSPFFIGELSRQVRAGLGLPLAGRNGTLETYLQARFEALPGTSRDVLEALAVAGHPVAWEALRRAFRIDRPDAEVLTPLRAGHLIRARGGGALVLEPYHDRIRQSILGILPEARVRALHRALAEALESGPEPDAQALCLHFQTAGEADRAGWYAVQAAEQAMAALAFGRAAEFYQRALELQAPKGRDRAAALLKLGDALAGAGLGGRAAEAYLEALPLVPPGEGLRLRRRIAEEFFRGGHFDRGAQALEEVLAGAGMRLPRVSWRAALEEVFWRLRLRLHGYRFQERPEVQVPRADLDRVDVCGAVAMGLGPVDPLRSAAFQSRFLLLALRAGEPGRIVRALALETVRLGNRERRGKATRWIQDQAMAVAERMGRPDAMSRALVGAGTAALMQGRWKAAAALLDRAEAMLQDHGPGRDFELHMAQFHGLLARELMGRMRDLEFRYSARIQAALDKGDRLATTNLRVGISPYIHLIRDEPGRALRELDQAISEWSASGFYLQHCFALAARVDVLIYSHDPAQACRVLEGAWPRLRRSRLLRTFTIRVVCLELRARARLALALGQRPEARNRLLRAADQDICRLEAEAAAFPDALALRLRAVESLALDRPDDAGALLYQAEQAFRRCDMALHAMAVRHRRGRLEGASGAEQTAVAEAWMRGQGIADPAQLVAMHLPG